MVEVQCAWLHPTRMCNYPGCQSKQTERSPHGWLVRTHDMRLGWPALRDPRPRWVQAGPALIEPRVMSPVQLSTLLYVNVKHGTGCGRRKSEGQSWPGSQTPPSPTPERKAGSVTFQRVGFLIYGKGGKGDCTLQRRWCRGNNTTRL